MVQIDAIREGADQVEARRLAARYVWWQDAETTLTDIEALLCRIMTDGTAEDYVAARELWGEAAFRRALEQAPPGAMDERSWRFWHLHFKMPLRPYPRRRALNLHLEVLPASQREELKLGRAGAPDRIPGKPAIASPLDLLATKLKVLHDRVEAKDYLDVEALLRSGLSLNAGIAVAQALFGAQLNPIDTAKMLTWFKDGGLERRLSAGTRRFLEAAAANFDPATPPLRLAAATLADRQP